MTLELTDQNFDSMVLGKSQPAVIDFMAEWCAPCKMIGMSMDALAEDYDGLAVIGKVDVDTNPELIARYGIRNMPTVLYLKDGEVMDRQVGATTRSVLEEKLKSML